VVNDAYTSDHAKAAQELGNRALDLAQTDSDLAETLLMMAANALSVNSEVRRRKIAVMRNIRARSLSALRIKVNESKDVRDYEDKIAQAEAAIGQRDAEFETTISLRDNRITDLQQNVLLLQAEVSELKRSKKRLREAVERARTEK
jgi:hypothetical protein